VLVVDSLTAPENAAVLVRLSDGRRPNPKARTEFRVTLEGAGASSIDLCGSKGPIGPHFCASG